MLPFTKDLFIKRKTLSSQLYNASNRKMYSVSQNNKCPIFDLMEYNLSYFGRIQIIRKV